MESKTENSSARSAIVFLLMILIVSLLGIYLKGNKAKKPVSVHNKDWGHSVQQTDDGGYIIAGWTDSFGKGKDDVYLIKTDAYGREVWHKTFGGRFGDYGRSVQQTKDGGYIVAGNTWPLGRIGSSKVYLLKVDLKGNKEWARTIGAGGSEYGFSVCRTGDGGYMVAGKTVRIDKGADNVYLIKTLADGTQAWSKTL